MQGLGSPAEWTGVFAQIFLSENGKKPFISVFLQSAQDKNAPPY